MPSGARIAVTTAERVLVGREELEAHRLHAGAAGAAEPSVAVERRLEALVEEDPERGVERQRRARRRA